MVNIKVDARESATSLLLYENDNILMIFDEVLRQNPRRFMTRRLEDAEENLERAARDIQGGAAWSVKRIVVAGQKPKTVSEGV